MKIYRNNTGKSVTLHLPDGDIDVPPHSEFRGTVAMHSITLLKTIPLEALEAALRKQNQEPHG